MTTHREPRLVREPLDRRRRNLADFTILLRRGAHVLARDPTQMLQLASYERDDCAPARAAALRLDVPRPPRAWLRLINKAGRLEPCVMTMLGHTKEISDCCHSPDGTSILSASWDGTLRFWDARTGETTRTLDAHSHWVLSACFAPNGHAVVSTSYQESKLWRTDTGDEVATLPSPGTNVAGCAVSPDGTEILTVAWDRSFSLWRRQPAGLRLRVVAHEDNFVRAGAYSPDGTRLLTASSDRTLRLWDRETGALIRTLRGHREQVFDCAFSPDGSLIVSASGDKTLKLWPAEPSTAWWRLRRDAPLMTLRGHRDLVLACAFSPDGTRIVSASHDRTLIIWNVADGEPMATLVGHQDHVMACAFAPDGTEIVSGCRDQTIRVWKVQAALEAARQVKHRANVLGCAVSADDRLVATASKDSTVRLWDTATGECLRILKGHRFWVDCCAFSPDHGALVSGGWKRIKLWNLATGTARFTRGGHYWHVHSCAFSPAGRWIASGDEAGRLFVWDAGTGKRIVRLAATRSWVTACVFAPGGDTLVGCSSDGRVRTWDWRGRVLLDEVPIAKNFLAHAALSPDGRKLAVVSDHRSAVVLDLATGSEELRIEGGQSSPRGCRFSPCGGFLLCVFDTGVLEVWDLAQQRRRATLLSQAAFEAGGQWPGVAALSWSGKVLAVGTSEGDVLLYRLMGVEWGPAVVTPVRLFDPIQGRYSGELTAACPSCHGRFAPNPGTLQAITSERSALERVVPWEVRASARSHPSLSAPCPGCQAPLRFNPFLVDDRERE